MVKEYEDTAMIALEIIANAGEARTYFLNALKEAENNNFEEAERLIENGNKCIVDAHKIQTNMIQSEARGEAQEIGFFMVHAQDHLMTIMLLRDIINNFISLYKRTNKSL
ncbi:PTS lactose/cellobiose transporter subunit IIA [Anaerosalibacter massiliensis]|uniref:PTS lactose/cellobiose transporter subunit IIA n=1 Tax=Anaerosalibacter massiliensis TaxID=1347392 RepID=A0A9X2MJ36_9FIRM|nr:PTS lactose/cellobiose transporter subunit IIA [Anaerosalibacter massiliensis]MCR2044441.1 PTS lactose/cellobiose transporter subunit IIA [Anaerosalibacter massiliensis]